MSLVYKHSIFIHTNERLANQLHMYYKYKLKHKQVIKQHNLNLFE